MTNAIYTDVAALSFEFDDLRASRFDQTEDRFDVRIQEDLRTVKRAVYLPVASGMALCWHPRIAFMPSLSRFEFQLPRNFNRVTFKATNVEIGVRDVAGIVFNLYI